MFEYVWDEREPTCYRFTVLLIWLCLAATPSKPDSEATSTAKFSLLTQCPKISTHAPRPCSNTVRRWRYLCCVMVSTSDIVQPCVRIMKFDLGASCIDTETCIVPSNDQKQLGRKFSAFVMDKPSLLRVESDSGCSSPLREVYVLFQNCEVWVHLPSTPSTKLTGLPACEAFRRTSSGSTLAGTTTAMLGRVNHPVLPTSFIHHGSKFNQPPPAHSLSSRLERILNARPDG